MRRQMALYPATFLRSTHLPRCGAHAQGFFYNRYTPIGNATGQSTGANKNQQLWYHVVGTPQAQDAFVLALPEQPDWSIGAGVTDDEKCARVNPGA